MIFPENFTNEGFLFQKLIIHFCKLIYLRNIFSLYINSASYLFG